MNGYQWRLWALQKHEYREGKGTGSLAGGYLVDRKDALGVGDLRERPFIITTTN